MKREFLLVMVILAVPFLNSCTDLYVTLIDSDANDRGPYDGGIFALCEDSWKEGFFSGSIENVGNGHYLFVYVGIGANPFAAPYTCSIHAFDPECSDVLTLSPTIPSAQVTLDCRRFPPI